ncbi:MAG: DNA-3-methyladenine glycosylase I [Burkholderiales bacterium]|nr:DNA-3-methyladenine glycosylase I [Burkholderiales bacterium]
MDDNKVRCGWCEKDDLYRRYHDEEWGRPLHDEAKHFEFLLLETMQAGLSWYTILVKRENYRQAFANFDPIKVAKYSEADIDILMQNAGIIRNRKKLEAAVTNANKFLEVQKEFGSFDRYIWRFSNNQVIDNHNESLSEVQASSELSGTVAKDLKNRGFKYVGSITIYAHLQAIGIINDHLINCWTRKV